jgi:plastocyanin
MAGGSLEFRLMHLTLLGIVYNPASDDYTCMSQGHTRRRTLTLIGATGAGLVAASFGGASDEHGGDDYDDEYADDDYDDADAVADVRAAHLSPDAPNVDVSVEGDAVLEDVPFRAVSEYLELPVGAAQVAISAAEDPDTVVFDEELELAEGAFTIAALGELSEENQSFAPAVLEDDVSDPGEDARVRLVHASPDAPAVDVTAGDGETVLFEDVEFGEADAIEVPAGEYTLEVRPATEDNDGDIVAEFDVAPEAGNVYSAFAVGYLDPEAAPADEPFDLEVVLDAAAETDMEEEDDEAVEGTQIRVGPDGENVFDPAELEVEVGTTVEFHWESGGHNVVPTSIPERSGWQGEPEVLDEGATHEHTFNCEGTYEYICEPHEDQRMAGEIHVVAHNDEGYADEGHEEDYDDYDDHDDDDGYDDHDDEGDGY